MKLEDQVCSFEQAKKLNQFLPTCETFFWYRDDGTLISVDDFRWAADSYIPALTVAELGVLLPYKIHDGDDWFMKCSRSGDNFLVSYIQYVADEMYFIPGSQHLVSFNTEAQARADALIWLLENNYLKASELKL